MRVLLSYRLHDPTPLEPVGYGLQCQRPTLSSWILHYERTILCIKDLPSIVDLLKFQTLTALDSWIYKQWSCALLAARLLGHSWTG